MAVIKAPDKNGKRLPRVVGLEALLGGPASERQTRYLNVVIPALQQAAPWVRFSKDPESVQMLFDFITISEGSQIGPTRSVRDATLQHVQKWNWMEHVELVSEIQHDCDDGDSLIARTIHINLDTPCFLHSQSRWSTLSQSAVDSKTPVSIARAKAMIQIPCSVKDGKPVKSIMEYGHGLFYHRGEVSDEFLSRYVGLSHDCLVSLIENI